MVADAADILLLDTSAAVALVVEDHEPHTATLTAVRGHRLGLAGHAWFESRRASRGELHGMFVSRLDVVYP